MSNKNSFLNAFSEISEVVSNIPVPTVIEDITKETKDTPKDDLEQNAKVIASQLLGAFF